MRLRVHFHLEREAAFPVDHQYDLQKLVYRLLGTSSAEYTEFLHDTGYELSGDSRKRTKLFVFSRLSSPQRRIVGDRLTLGAGRVTWQISSPVEDFLNHSVSGLLMTGSRVTVCGNALEVCEVEALPAPTFGERMRFSCLTPIVASKALGDGRTYYYRPSDGAAFSEALRGNLLRKYAALYGAGAEEAPFRVEFDGEYLARHRGGTKLVRFKETNVVGAFAPFTVSGAPELLRLAWDSGLGEKNSGGFGMIDLRNGR